MNLNDKTVCFNGRVIGMQYQLRITPSMVALHKATEAEMLVLDAFGLIADSFTRAFHYQYDAEYIKRSMREYAKTRDELPELKENTT